MVAAGALETRRRRQAEYLAWSAVHGFALLLIEGPLQALGPEEVEPLAARLLAMVEQGL